MFNTLEIPHASSLYLKAVALRSEVLRKPLGLVFNEEELKAESAEIHLGLMQHENLLAVLSLKPISTKEVKMRQVAVAPDFQQKGLGRQLVEYSETVAQSRGYQTMSLHARDTAVPFYLKLGYTIQGDEFLEVGIKHFKMLKNIG